MNEDEWRKNNWRCNHGWLRGEQCEICNAPKREFVGLTDEHIERIYDRYGGDMMNCARAIERELREKNT